MRPRRCLTSDLVRGHETVKLRNVETYVAALRALGVEPSESAVS